MRKQYESCRETKIITRLDFMRFQGKQRLIIKIRENYTLKEIANIMQRTQSDEGMKVKVYELQLKEIGRTVQIQNHHNIK